MDALRQAWRTLVPETGATFGSRGRRQLSLARAGFRGQLTGGGARFVLIGLPAVAMGVQNAVVR